jgi:hypothetical protein
MLLVFVDKDGLSEGGCMPGNNGSKQSPDSNHGRTSQQVPAVFPNWVDTAKFLKLQELQYGLRLHLYDLYKTDEGKTFILPL